ncbi:MAG: hypothetical protein NXY57DRAFT_902021, partial [Lentinula lateritia]
SLKSNKAREVDVEVVLLAKEKSVVLFLVPKADTRRLTFQTILLSSVDCTPFAFLVHKTASCRTLMSGTVHKPKMRLALLSDTQHKLISALRANDKSKTKRSHFVKAGKGKLFDSHIDVKPVDR